jgi:tetratricopeptide (TPR) repeat protein
MFALGGTDERYLLRQMQLGQAVLVLGAGASAGSKNRYGNAIKSGPELARILCNEAGLPFNGEPLPTVYEAVRGARLSDVQIQAILQREYSDVTASPELSTLFSVCWRRLYTFNIDDAVDNLGALKSGQRRRYFNGLIDRVADFEGPLYLQVIYLNGQATKPEHGLIFSESEYARAVKNESLFWYNRAGQDYFTCPIFIGSRLDEPVLWSQIERAKRTENTTTGLGFAITPTEITDVQIQSLRNRGIVHIRGTIADFSHWIRKHFPNGITPTDIVKTSSIENKDLRNLGPDDINAAHYLKPVLLNNVTEQIARRSDSELNKMGRLFYQGFPPTWELAASDIPVYLENSEKLYEALCAAIDDRHELFVVTGEAGSGKTTAVMMTLLKYLRGGHRKVYEVSGDVRSVRHIFSVLKKLSDPAIVYIGDLFLYGDHLADDLEQIRGSEIIAVTSARSGEWNEHFSRHLGSHASNYKFNRFTKQDYEPLLTRLNKYVPAPAFKMLTRAAQLQKLASSKRQLLIALHETTDSQNFSDVITAEFERLPDQDTKRLCLIVGLGTIARVGIGLEFAAAAYELRAKRPLKSALEALAGIVELTPARRLVARHEIYIREIVENVISSNDFVSAACDILDVYAKFEIPVIRKVNRVDGHLFKFLLNADFVYRMGLVHGNPDAGRIIFERYEIDFQLDGHFWLQYGLFLIKLNKYEDSLQALKRSIEAYPENPFAQHALAHLKLRIALHRQSVDTATEQLIGEAVESLEILHTRSTPSDDQYPLVTLAMVHVQVLATHGKHAEARTLARKYHGMLQEMGRRISNGAITRAEHAMLRYVTLGEIPGKQFGPATPSVPRVSRSKERQKNS